MVRWVVAVVVIVAAILLPLILKQIAGSSWSAKQKNCTRTKVINRIGQSHSEPFSCFFEHFEGNFIAFFGCFENHF